MSNAFLDAVQKELSGASTDSPEPTAHEDMIQGFRQIADEAQKAITPLVENMSSCAKEARRILDTTSQWTFGARLKARAKVRELEAKFNAAAAQIEEVRNEVRTHGAEGHIKDFNEEVDAHLANMKRHFKDENFVKDRF